MVEHQHRIQVCPEIPPCSQAMPFEDAQRCIEERFGKAVESCCFTQNAHHQSPPPTKIRSVGMNKCHSLVEAACLSFSQHYGLTISPDDIWICLLQALAIHIDIHPDKYRDRFLRDKDDKTTNQEGKKEITIERNDFIKGSPNNDWSSVLSQFSQAIKSYIGEDLHSLLLSDFTTTSDLQKIVSEVSLMDVCKDYFNYTIHTSCGIPFINVRGSLDDWRKLRKNAEKLLRQFDLSWWLDTELLAFLDHFVIAVEGKDNEKEESLFWRSFFKHCSISGDERISGHILALFPYVRSKKNPSQMVQRCDGGDADQTHDAMITTATLPSGMSEVPFVWNWYTQKMNMKFVAGFVGVHQDPVDLSLSPFNGWVITKQ